MATNYPTRCSEQSILIQTGKLPCVNESLTHLILSACDNGWCEIDSSPWISANVKVFFIFYIWWENLASPVATSAVYSAFLQALVISHSCCFSCRLLVWKLLELKQLIYTTVNMGECCNTVASISLSKFVKGSFLIFSLDYKLFSFLFFPTAEGFLIFM